MKKICPMRLDAKRQAIDTDTHNPQDDHMPIDFNAHALTMMSRFGDQVIYRPRVGQPRVIRAIVDRNPPVALDGVPGRSPITAPLVLEVANDSTGGISTIDLDTGGDEVELSLRVGETPVRRPIVRILSQDAGMLRLEVR